MTENRKENYSWMKLIMENPAEHNTKYRTEYNNFHTFLFYITDVRICLGRFLYLYLHYIVSFSSLQA